MHWSYPIRFVLGFKVLAANATLAKLKGLFWTGYAQTWDLYLNIDNWVSPKRDPRNVILLVHLDSEVRSINQIITPRDLTRFDRRLVPARLLASHHQ